VVLSRYKIQSSTAAYSTLAARWQHREGPMNHRPAVLTSNVVRLEVGCASAEAINRKTARDQLSQLPRRQGFYNLKLATFEGVTDAG
jgi:hypothetical protein